MGLRWSCYNSAVSAYDFGIRAAILTWILNRNYFGISPSIIAFSVQTYVCIIYTGV